MAAAAGKLRVERPERPERPGRLAAGSLATLEPSSMPLSSLMAYRVLGIG
jgi:hypothetical protein